MQGPGLSNKIDNNQLQFRGALIFCLWKNVSCMNKNLQQKAKEYRNCGENSNQGHMAL